MTFRKIRGQRRIYRRLPAWIEGYRSLAPLGNLENKRGYAKLRFHPWGSLNLINSHCPPPSGKIKREFERGLLAIFESWFKQLSSIKMEFYLAIWYDEHDVSRSQVVFATGTTKDFYQGLFEPKEINRKFPYTFANEFNVNQTELTWQTCWEYYPVYSSDHDWSSEDDELTTTYKKRTVWLGQIFYKSKNGLLGAQSSADNAS